MAASITCTDIVRANGTVYVRWNDGTESEFSSVQNARQTVRAFFDDAGPREFLKAIAIAKALNAAQDGAQLSAMIGKTITLDLSLAANIVRVT